MTERGIIVAATLLALPAAAQEVAVTLPLGPGAEVIAARYACEDGRDVPVQYVNAGANALALVTLDEEVLVFAGVVSGSGSRYVSGGREWWIKGDTATFTDQFDEGAATECTAGE
ncbi:MliC family protein [Jannaschia rubra]|uniref:MliC family protein n=1 Tax=Jannaschia rubra TaxID=282197 RepID=UPI002491E316|nr:MliC family protein [Jannaschia rubra]